ncbi:hypothetical protein [Parelusimicrobium proximum]|uniref:hypothetical protein n=1 Tax=Parelusimicrobium proximum TaxID=3228953 RepID=UPI003D16BA43
MSIIKSLFHITYYTTKNKSFVRLRFFAKYLLKIAGYLQIVVCCLRIDEYYLQNSADRLPQTWNCLQIAAGCLSVASVFLRFVIWVLAFIFASFWLCFLVNKKSVARDKKCGAHFQKCAPQKMTLFCPYIV